MQNRGLDLFEIALLVLLCNNGFTFEVLTHILHIVTHPGTGFRYRDCYERSLFADPPFWQWLLDLIN